MPIKAVGAVLIMTSGILIGVSLKSRLSYRVDLLKEVYDFLLYIKRNLNYDMPALSDLFCQYGTEWGCGLIGVISDSLENDEPFEKIVEHSFSAAEIMNTLNDSEKNYLKNVFLQLGSSDSESQLMLIDSAAAQLECMIKESTEEKDRKSRVYMSVSVYSGMIIAILLI